MLSSSLTPSVVDGSLGFDPSLKWGIEFKEEHYGFLKHTSIGRYFDEVLQKRRIKGL